VTQGRGSGPLGGDGSWPAKTEQRLGALELEAARQGMHVEHLAEGLEEQRESLQIHDQLLRGPEGILTQLTRGAGAIKSQGEAIAATSTSVQGIEKKIDSGKTWLIVLLVGTLVTKGIDWWIEAAKAGLAPRPAAASAVEHRTVKGGR